MGAPRGPAVYLLVFYGVFCIYASKTRVFLPRGFKILVFYCVSYIPRLRNLRILRCFLHTEASKPSYFTVFPTWYASKTRVFLLPRLQNPRILRCFLHGLPQKHECFSLQMLKMLENGCLFGPVRSKCSKMASARQKISFLSL